MNEARSCDSWSDLSAVVLVIVFVSVVRLDLTVRLAWPILMHFDCLRCFDHRELNSAEISSLGRLANN